MKQQINDEALDQVVGGIVRVSGNKGKVNFTTMQKVYTLKCDPDDASFQAQVLYRQYKDQGDLAYEQAVEADFKSRGWI